MDRKNENQFQLKKTASDMVKSLLIAYVVTGIFLLILTLLLYKMGLSEQKVNSDPDLRNRNVFRRICNGETFHDA